MSSLVITEIAHTDHVPAPNAPADEFSPAFVQTARVELQASLQLLAERARFLTGATWVAIALNQQKHDATRESQQLSFTYRAATGNSAPEIDAEVDSQIVHSIDHTKPVCRDGKILTVPVIRNSRTAGFLELYSENATFTDQDIQSTVRLSELINTALDLMNAAEQAQAIIACEIERHSLSAKSDARPASAGIELASSWRDAAAKSAPGVHACQSCGFPVSEVRALCVDCEERAGTAAAISAPALFSLEKEESWVSAHGYTIASILLPVIAAAIIYWLR